MARIIPQYDEVELQQIKSEGERKFYRHCRELSDDFLVFYSVPWIRPFPGGGHGDAETDFILVHKTKGILMVEVKGGGIKYDSSTNSWFSEDRHGEVHRIKDPFQQAKNTKYNLLNFMENQGRRSGLLSKPPVQHAVFFPEVGGSHGLTGTDHHPEIIGTSENLRNLENWALGVFKFWGGNSEVEPKGSGTKGFHVIEKFIHADCHARPILSSILNDEETERIRLTEEQARVVSGLRMRQKAAISGGAGTGKTLLALYKAEELCNQGKKVLLLSYNRLLGDQLYKQSETIPNLDAMAYHQFCYWCVELAKEKTGNDFLEESKAENPQEDLFDFHYPLALDKALEFVDKEYDAIIIDEAQDFRDEYWMPILTMIDKNDSMILFVFFDNNQAIYTLSEFFPIQEEPFVLSRNCRNTQHIHRLAYQFYSGIETEGSTIKGQPAEIISAPTITSQADRLHSKIVDLLQKERLAPDKIVVLVPSEKGQQYYEEISRKPLPGQIRWGFRKFGFPNTICVETVKRFKGLEADYLIFWGVDHYDLEDEDDKKLLYVAISRAKSRLCLIGPKDACELISSLDI